MKRLKMTRGWFFQYYPAIWSFLFCLLTFIYLKFGWGEYVVSNHPGAIKFFTSIFPATEWLSNNSPRFRDQLIPIGFFMRILFILGLARILYLYFRYRKLFFYYGLPMSLFCNKGTLKELFKLGFNTILIVLFFIAIVYSVFFWGSEVLLMEDQLDNDTRIYLFRDDIKFNTVLGFIHIMFFQLLVGWMMIGFVLETFGTVNKCILARKYRH